MAGLAFVRPALGLRGADAVETWGVWELAEPASNEDVLEVVGVTGGKDLGHGAGVELMLEATDGLVCGLLGVAGKFGVVRESAETHGSAPLGDDTFP